jgi:hypothetical protein
MVRAIRSLAREGRINHFFYSNPPGMNCQQNRSNFPGFSLLVEDTDRSSTEVSPLPPAGGRSGCGLLPR